MLRRLHPDQPESFAFTPANHAWAEAQISKYPEGRQASAIIALLWRAQEQEGWLTRPAIEGVADMLDMPRIRALEVASFYFMFHMQPVGSVANIQICGTTSCMICGAEDLIAVCREKIADTPHTLSADGKFSWEEVECLGACANAPMAQIGKDYYEDLTTERFAELLDELAAGKVPVPGPQNGRYASEPKPGLTSLKEFDTGKTRYNASVQLATDLGDTIKRIDGSEVPPSAPWRDKGAMHEPAPPGVKLHTQPVKITTRAGAKANAKAEDGVDKTEPVSKLDKAERPANVNPDKDDRVPEAPPETVAEASPGVKPKALDKARAGKADNLKLIKGVGPKLEKLLNKLGFFHFDQIAAWSEDEVTWVDENLEGFKGRVSRDGWVAQARILAEGGETEFSARKSK